MNDTTDEERTEKDARALPKEAYAHCIRVDDLAKMLARKNVISEDEFDLLVMRGYILPKLEVANEDNWMQLRDDLLAFLRPPPQKVP
ncbi:MAG TPA: hypothetical protein PLE77_04740 [Kiritimatiellia bacterium]|nr:hypothetical protein [Kiritimatiellia bacterium]